MTQFKEAVSAVLQRYDHYETAMSYYEGDVPEVFATRRLRQALAHTGINANINFCRPIVNAVANRLEIGAVSTDSLPATDAVEKIRVQNHLEFEEPFLHTNACAAGDYFAMVWPDEDGEVQISFLSPTNAAMVYDPLNHRKALYGVQLWQSGQTEHRLNILTKDEIRKYVAQTGSVTDATNWTYVETVENPWGRIPMFHFRTHMPQGRPEHYDAYDLQNNVNKLFVTNMHTIDYQGAPTRYALSSAGEGGELSDFDDSETERENMGSLKNGPGELWFLKNVDKVGEFKPADPQVFWTPIREAVRTMSAVTDTPLHFFDRTGNNPTGDGLRTAEAPLLKKIEDRQRLFGHTWSELYEFALLVLGIKATVTIYWKPIDAMDETERWDVALKKINSGLSHRQALREGGYPDEQIEKIMQERKQEQADGLYYQRAPQVRVNTDKDETQAVSYE